MIPLSATMRRSKQFICNQLSHNCNFTGDIAQYVIFYIYTSLVGLKPKDEGETNSEESKNLVLSNELIKVELPP